MTTNQMQSAAEHDVLDAAITHSKSGVSIIVTDAGRITDLLIATKLRYMTGGSVLAIEPNRHRAMYAANVVGHHLSAYDTTGRDINTDTRRPRIAFTSFERALSTKSIDHARTIILNGTQNPSYEATLCKALIKQRLLTEWEPPQVIVIATKQGFHLEAEIAYWVGNNPGVFTVPTYTGCESTFHWKTGDLVDTTLTLVTEGHHGILVFTSSHKEAVDTVVGLRKTLKFQNHDSESSVEIMTLTSQTPVSDCLSAFRPPQPGQTKILVGTSILETISGLEWVSAGVSCGRHKTNALIRSAVDLQEEPITKAKLETQRSITGFYNNSTFILCGKENPNQLKDVQDPEVVRLPLSQFLMQCAHYGIEPRALDVETCFPSMTLEDLQNARVVLVRLGFLNSQTNQLTSEGDFARTMPISLETSALLCHAGKLGIIPQAVVLATAFEIGNFRADHERSHGFDNTSNVFDSAYAFSACYRFTEKAHREERRQMMIETNLNGGVYYQALELLWMLERTIGVKADFDAFIKPDSRKTYRDKLRQCILAANILRVGAYTMKGNLRKPIVLQSGLRCGIDSRSGIIFPSCGVPITTTLKVVMPYDQTKPSFSVASNITIHSVDDFIEFDRVRPGIISLEIPSDRNLGMMVRVFGKEIVWHDAPQSIPFEKRRPPSNVGTVSETQPVSRESLQMLADRFKNR